MEDLTPQERFDQLLAFLEDPDKHSYTRTGHNRRFPIDSITFPSLDLEDLVFLPGRRHRAGLVNDFRQEAIEVMLSDMFRDRLLRGNQKTGDIVIEQPEEFVLPVAAVIHTVRDYRAKSLSAGAFIAQRLDDNQATGLNRGAYSVSPAGNRLRFGCRYRGPEGERG